ncbi:ATP-grasp fold domain protein, DUF201-type [Candidatus Protofrankia datiscae]|uniref:ATP-grasp fold domain protein, DUF201-type n=1 Tax=Candidatus Protofrankia datiscae TaxID=2716812 RepID=F8AVX9_9ACTN|nr:ATP-grasp fold domain protein, DUF201-type [Candidatus Protofrankia datiscae]
MAPFSTGSQLAPEFARHGWESVAVVEGEPPASYAASFRPDDFVEVVQAATDPAATAALLRRLGTHQVLAGSEWGVDLADQLTTLLGLPGNAHLPGRPRRDKYAMMRRLRSAGLRTPASLVTDDEEQMLTWAAHGRHWPVVVKPRDSAGSDGVVFCAGPAQARSALATLDRAYNALGLRNDGVLVQERLTGQQYFVNSVSIEGRHHVHEIWRDDRLFVREKPVYDRQRLLPARGDVQDVAVPYVLRVLDALGIREGPAHTELFVDDDGPVIIECGARLEGGVTPRGPVAATGDSQVSLTVLRYVDPAGFATRLGTPYDLRRQLHVVCLTAPYDGIMAAAGLDEIARMPGILCGSALNLRPGSRVRRTVDLFTSPGHLYLLADDERELERAYRRIRELEVQGLYLPA